MILTSIPQGEGAHLAKLNPICSVYEKSLALGAIIPWARSEETLGHALHGDIWVCFYTYVLIR